MKIKKFRKTPIALAIALALAENPAAQASPGDFVSGVLTANRTRIGQQQDPDVAMDAAGNAVMVWESEDQDGDGFGIIGQIFRAGGIRVGAEFRVNSTTTGDQKNPAVSMDADGDFVVAFESPDDDGTGIRARRFDRNGNPRGDDFAVNSETSTDQFDPAIDSDAFGGFIIAWDSGVRDFRSRGTNVRVKRFSPEGEALPIDGQPEVTEYPIDNAFDPDVAMDADGDHVIAWLVHEGPRSVGYYTYEGNYTNLRTFDRTNKPTSEIIRLFSQNYALPILPTDISRDDHDPKVEMDTDGDFVAVVSTYFPAYFYFPKGALFDKVGNRKRDLNDGDLLPLRNANSSPSVAMDADGDFVVVVEGKDCYNYRFCYENFGIASFFDKSGDLVNQVTETIFEGDSPNNLAIVNPTPLASGNVAIDADGDVLAVWDNDLTPYDDPATAIDKNVYARRLRGFEKIDLSLEKKDLADPVVPGGVIDYQIQVNNLHPGLQLSGYRAIDSAIGAASGVKLTDQIPNGAVLLSAKGNGWNCKIEGKDPQCFLSQVLAPGDQATLDLKVRAPQSGDNVINQAEVRSNQDDPNPENNQAQESTVLKSE